VHKSRNKKSNSKFNLNFKFAGSQELPATINPTHKRVHSNLLIYLISPLILIIATIIAYYPSLFYKFFFDDFPTIIENFSVIKNSQNYWGEFYNSNRWISRFLNNLSYYYWQKDPFFYRVINLGIHIFTGIFIFFLVLKTLKINKNSFLKKYANSISFLTGALFLLHPLQTQTATFITQMRLEGLVAFFTFLILLIFTYTALTKNILLKFFLYFITLILTSFAAGTKEIVVVLPILILIFDWFFISRGIYKIFLKNLIMHALIFIALFGTLAKFRWHVTDIIKQVPKIEIDNSRGNIVTQNSSEKITVKNYSISQPKIILHYLTIFFLPHKIAFDYDYKLSKSILDLDTIIPLFIIFLILALSLFLFLKNKNNIFAFCTLWFFICILPRASILPTTELICDYKTYLASFSIYFFISIIFFYLTNYLLNFKFFKIIKLQKTILLLSVILLAISTWQRNLVWSSELAFWQDAVKKTPNKARLLNNYGVALAENNKTLHAIKIYKKAIELDPTYAEPIINLAQYYQNTGNIELALQYYKKAIVLKEVHPEMYLNLGVIAFQANQFEQARDFFDMAIKIKPYYSLAHFNLAQTYIKLNDVKKACEHFEKHLSGDDPDKKVIFLLANLYYQIREYKKALPYFEEIYKQNPQNKAFAYNLGQVLLNLQKFEQALNLFKICQNEPENFPCAFLHTERCISEINESINKKEFL